MIQTECIYSNIVEVGKKENIQRIVDALQEMQMVMKEIAGQIQSGGFSLNDSSYQELKNDYLVPATVLVDIMNGQRICLKSGRCKIKGTGKLIGIGAV